MFHIPNRIVFSWPRDQCECGSRIGLFSLKAIDITQNIIVTNALATFVTSKPHYRPFGLSNYLNKKSNSLG